jgi:L,D-transpeptidase catalytic domain
VGWRTRISILAVLGSVVATGSAMYGDDLLAGEPTAAGRSQTATSRPTGAAPVQADLLARPRPEPNRPVAPLDPRCETGRAMCVDKTTRTLRWVVGGRVLMTFDARFGGPKTPTREGAFRVYDMLRHHESSIYGTQMPFAMFFSGGQAVHYSKEFAVQGYDGASHGCVNVRDRRGIAELFDRVREGDRVVVYRS